MADSMTPWERVRAALRGDEVDRPTVSAWRHFYRHETPVQGLAEAMLEFQRRFDWDFMKVNPRASYNSEAWGHEASLEQLAVNAGVSSDVEALGATDSSLDKDG